MAEVIGPQNILNHALPTGWDATRLAEWQLRDGITYGELVNQLALALGDFNQQMVTDWGWLFFLTEEIALEYEDGGSVTPMPEITDSDKPEALHGTTIGHMVDLLPYGQGIGGTRRYFRDARSAKINAAVSTLVRRARWRFEQKLLNRWFTNTENAIGSAGYDVPFVRGTGGNVDFAPPAFDGEAFTSSHTHYIAVDSDSEGFDQLLLELAETIQEHGHVPPYTAMVARADTASYYALTNFVEVVDPIISTIDRASVTTGGQFFTQGQRAFGRVGFYQSEYGLIELRATARIPTGYAALAKSYGQLDARNPLAVRVHPAVGFGTFVVPETTPDDDYPVKQIDVEFEFGVSAGADRTNGAACYRVADNTWANPTVS